MKEKTPSKQQARTNGANASKKQELTPERLEVLKTYKLFIGGRYPRTESGRYFTLKNSENQHIANMCQASRKDFRDAVVEARRAFTGWAGRTAYNRAQIIYRLAEILEGRKEQLIGELILCGMEKAKAAAEVKASIDRVVYYAGWADKYVQVFSAVNPVASSHFNFSIPEPTGVVSILTSQHQGLCGLLSVILPVITGGNTCIVLASKTFAPLAISLAEALSVSDVPGGVINLLTGFEDELYFHFSSHMDVNAIVYGGNDVARLKQIQELATHNLKRVAHHYLEDYLSEEAENPYWIMGTQEVKTTWHPVGS